MENCDMENGVGQMIAAGSALGEVKTVSPEFNEKKFLIVPDGYKTVEVETESLLPAPRRNKGTVTLATVDSFLLFTERELIPGTTVCFSGLEGGRFETVFNYAENGERAGWGDRVARLRLDADTAWSRWRGNSDRKMGQLALCDFIENNMEDISSPAAADIVEMITALRVHRKAEFTSVVDPKTGFANLVFSESTSGETIKGNIEFCGQMVLGLSPYRGGEKYAINARLRFSINDNNKLEVFFSLINADIVKEHAFDTVRGQVAKRMGELGIPIFDI